MEKIGAMSMSGFETSGCKPADANAEFASLYKNLNRPVFLLSLSILRDYALAEDIMQQTFLQAMEHADSFRAGRCRPDGGKKAWVMSIAHNLALNCLKKQGREELNLDSYLETETGVENDLTGSADYLQAMSLLDEQERTIVTLKAVCGFRHAQIAKIAGISVVDSRAKYSRALKKLKRHYLESGFQA